MPMTPDLVALGVPAELAKRIGFQGSERGLASITAAGTGGSAPTVMKRDVNAVSMVTAGGATDIKLPADAELMVPYFVYNSTATTGAIYPPTGHKLNAVATNSGVTLAVNLARFFWRTGATTWSTFLVAS